MRARRYFEAIARDYRRERYGAEAGPWRRSFFTGRLRIALSLAGPRPGRVLDLGAGPGVLGDELAARGARVFSLDVAAPMLDPADGRSVAADAVAIPFRDATFDTVLALGLTTYVADLDRLLLEAARVLRPGGRLVVTFTRHGAPDTLLRGALRATFGRVLRRRGVLTAGVAIRPVSDGAALRALRRAGFDVEAVRGHNATVFPFAYLFERASVRLGKRLEARAADGVPALASDLVVSAIRRTRTGAAAAGRAPIRVVRIIARLNVGGPARQAILLTKRLDALGFESTLVTGRVGPDEGDMLPEARRQGVEPVVIEGLGRAPSPLDDLRALGRLWRLLRRVRPRVVHTHTAKAGTLGRIAAVLAGVPVRIHTFHGHVLHGYFGRVGSALVRATESALARITTRVVAVSEEVAGDLAVRHRAIPRAKIEVVPLGLELDALYGAERRRGELRAELGIAPDAPLLGFVGRLTAVKEPEVLIRAFARIAAAEPRAILLVAGDGDRRSATEAAAARAGLGDRVRFLGWRDDLDRLWADLDLALLTSRNEGTPVALIEAAAAAVPAVATRVGGVPAVVLDGETGLLVPRGDDAALAAAALSLLRDPARRRAMGAAARARVRPRHGAAPLLRSLAALYRT